MGPAAARQPRVIGGAAANPAAPIGVANASRVAVPDRTRVDSTAMAPARTTSRTPAAAAAPPAAPARNVLRARRVSKIIVEKEKKTDYWQDVIQAAKAESDLSQEDINNIISRAMALELVGNWKQREDTAQAPSAQQLFREMEVAMQQKIALLNNNRPFQVSAVGIEKIRQLENELQRLEAIAEKAQAQEEERLKSKKEDLERSLRVMREKKEADVENKRRTMSLELNNLREQMAMAAQAPTVASNRNTQDMADKMARMEAALRLLNEERKKGVDDKETIMLKKKLAAFEAKLQEVSEQKQMAAAEEHGDALREKLLLMEDKLAKMERRKSVSITMMMQQKMQEVEAQLSQLRVAGGGGSDAKVAALEKKLIELQNTKVTPGMVNDAETNALRSHVKKLEDSMRLAEQKMEEQRMKIEQERMIAWKKKQEEEEEYRKKARMREDMLLQKMAEMEKKFATGGGGRGGPPPPGGGGIDAAMMKKLEEMERRLQSTSSNPLQAKLEEMERRLRETETQLVQERSTSSVLLDAIQSKGGEELVEAHKDVQIAMLKQQTELLMKRLEENSKKMEDSVAALTNKVDNMKFTGGGGGAVQHKSGLTYDEINAKMNEIQAKLFDENTPEKEAEALNIEYEKLISELEQTPEYLKEQEELVNKWKRENEPLNAKALETMRAKLASMSPQERNTLLGRKGELKFLGFTQDQIMKKHVNDFKGVTTQNLDETEARALYACMPVFRKDQEAQVQFVEQLKNKIEVEVKKPKTKPPPPIQAAKKVVFKKPPAGGGGGGGSFLDELVRKRKAIE